MREAGASIPEIASVFSMWPGSILELGVGTRFGDFLSPKTRARNPGAAASRPYPSSRPRFLTEDNEDPAGPRK